MALATTCPQCKTSFKVVPDQLKLRRGMVRCGMCQHVFSGIDFLRYVDEGPRKAAGPAGARAPATVIEKPDREPAPADQGHTDLKTAFFLPETVFQPTAIAPPQPARPAPAPDRQRLQVPESLQARPPAGEPARAHAHAGSLTSVPGGVTVQTGTITGPAPAADAVAAPGAAAEPDIEIGLPAEPGARHTDGGTSGDPATVSGVAAAPEAGHAARAGSADEQHPAAEPAPSRNRRATDRLQVAPPPGSVADDEPVLPTAAAAVETPAARAPAADPLTGDAPTAAAPPPHTRGSAALPADDTLADDSAQQDVDAVRASFESERRSRWFRPGSEEADAIDYFGDERRARGFSGRAAPLVWVAYGLLSLLLALQLLMGFAPRLFELYPNMVQPFAALLSPWRTRAEMPRNLKALTIESFELAAAPTPGVLLLSAVLRNDAPGAVKWPAMELSLTDGGGALLVRKVILPQDYLEAVYAGRPGAAPGGLNANAELPLRLALEARDLTPAGYAVTLFYP